MGLLDFRSAASILMDRLRWARQAGITFGGRRDLYDILGYSRWLEYGDFRARYQRDGIAKRIVEAYPNATWRGGVELYEDEDPNTETKFEAAWKELEQKFGIWQRLQSVDILSGLSTYGVLLIGAPVPVGGSLADPLPKGKPGDLLYFTAFSGGGGPGGDQRNLSSAIEADATIAEFETDARNPRFGEPTYYRLKRTNVASPLLQSRVHWSRVLHIAEGCLDDNVYGVPTLENVWNLLDDLAKVTGGGAEAFWLRANAGIHLDVDKDMAFAAPKPGEKSEIDRLKEQAEDYSNQLTRMLRTRGVAVTQLGSDVANFGPSADAILKQIAGSKGIPMRILTGSEMGTLASEQDAANFDSQVQDRRTGYAGPRIVRPLVDRLIEYGYLPKPTQYEVGWPVEENMDEKGKAGFAVQLASVNSTYGSVVFTDEEIRDMAFDKEPLTAKQQKAVADAAAKKVADAQAAMVATAKPEPAKPELVAAEDAELLRVLEAAIVADNVEVIAEILGMRAAGDAPGHEFHGNQWTEGADSRDIPRNPDVAHGTVVATSKFGKIIAQRNDASQPARFVAERKNGETVGTFKHTHGAADALREPKNSESFSSGYRSPDVPWKIRTLDVGPHKYASCQVQLTSEPLEAIITLAMSIPDEELAADGRELDAHVTVKYGLLNDDRMKLQSIVATYKGPVALTFGKTAHFETPDYDVVYVGVFSPALDALNKRISTMIECAPSDHGVYVPHATVAYVKSGLGTKYDGMTAMDGMTMVASSLVLGAADGERSEVQLA